VKRHEDLSALAILMQAAFQQSGVQQTLQGLEILLLPRIGTTRPSLQVVSHGTVQQTNGVGIQIELKPWSWISHGGILTQPHLDAAPESE
jgi:hypothetical protein